MLELLNKALSEKFDHMGTEKHDIVTFLKKSLEQRGPFLTIWYIVLWEMRDIYYIGLLFLVDEIADLNDRITGLQQAKDAEKEAYEGQLQQLRNELQETKDLLTSENLVLCTNSFWLSSIHNTIDR